MRLRIESLSTCWCWCLAFLKWVHVLNSRSSAEMRGRDSAILGNLHEPRVFRIMNVQFVWPVCLFNGAVSNWDCMPYVAMWEFRNMSISLAGSQTICWPSFYFLFFQSSFHANAGIVPRFDNERFPIYLSSIILPFGAYIASDEVGPLL
jgi:hypothetical protein